MSGWIRIERKLCLEGHPDLKPEPFTEREAWLWIIARCAWEDTTHRVGGVDMPVPRGSFMTTLREMQVAWRWTSDKRVRGFLQRLENGRTIGRAKVGPTNAPKTHVTVCKYNEYQAGGRATDGPRTGDGRTEGRSKETNITINKEDTDVSCANEASAAVRVYNEAAATTIWPAVQNLNPTRSKQLKARLHECGGLEGWEVALRRALQSDFLTGKSAKPWTGFGFDWLIKAANFTKLMEGNYDNRTQPPGGPGGGQRARPDAALSNIARLAGLGETPGDGGGGTGGDGQETGRLRVGAR